MSHVLILYYSQHGSTKALAEEISIGVEQQGDFEARLRTVAEVSNTFEQTAPKIPESGSPHVTLEDFSSASAVIIGSPAYFGNMSAALKYFFDQTSQAWLAGSMIGKPAAVFTSSSSIHGGQESVLLNMMLPLLHHGMIISGIPYSVPELHQTQTGGSPYGVTHLALNENNSLDDHESKIAQYLGKRIANLAAKLEHFNQ